MENRPIPTAPDFENLMTRGEMIAAEGEKAEAALEVFEDPAFLKELVQKLAVREF